MRLAVTLAALALAGCASTPEGSMPIRGDAYYTMPLDGLQGRVTVTNDPLDGYRMASSADVRAQHIDLFGIDSDVFFRAFAWDSGDHAVQIYFRTEAPDWLFPRALNFGQPVRSVDVTSVASDVSCRSGGCEHFESVVAKLSPADVRYLLGPDTPDLFEVRLKTQSGANVDRTLRKDELRAVLAAAGIVDRY